MSPTRGRGQGKDTGHLPWKLPGQRRGWCSKDAGFRVRPAGPHTLQNPASSPRCLPALDMPTSQSRPRHMSPVPCGAEARSGQEPPSSPGKGPQNSTADSSHHHPCPGLEPAIKPYIHQRDLGFKEDPWPAPSHCRAPSTEQSQHHKTNEASPSPFPLLDKSEYSGSLRPGNPALSWYNGPLTPRHTHRGSRGFLSRRQACPQLPRLPS